MNRGMHDEYRIPPEESAPADEFRIPDELTVRSEFFAPAPENLVSDEYSLSYETVKNDGENGGRERKRRKMLLPLVSALAAASVVFASFDTDFLGKDYLNSVISAVFPTPPAYTEAADASFPTLDNLAPNGAIDGYGVLNEEFIRIQTDSDDLFIVAGSAWRYTDENGVQQQIPLSTVPGVSYDRDSNTLTLDNYSGQVLNVNIMGNGFTLRLIGDNRLEHLLVWGFHYGGSVKITGEGSLTVNSDMNYSTGIFLTAEFSQSCLMVDSGVRLESYGTDAAIMVHATSMSKAIYYLEPLTLSGGIRISGDYVLMSDNRYSSAHGNYRDYTIASDETGTPSKHVIFS